MMSCTSAAVRVLRRHYALKVAHFADEGPGRDDGEANPQPPHNTAQDRDDLVSEELCGILPQRVTTKVCDAHGWERHGDEDEDRDEWTDFIPIRSWYKIFRKENKTHSRSQSVTGLRSLIIFV